MDYDFDYYVFEAEYCQNPDRDKLPNANDHKYLEYCELLMRAKEAGLGYRVEWEGTLYLAPTPIVRLNPKNEYHSESGPSLFWKDSKEQYYYLNGVSFPKPLFKKVTSGDMDFGKILAIVDVDQRTQAMKFGDRGEFLRHAGGEILDEYEKDKPDGTRVFYKLYRIPQGEIFATDAYYMVYSCPSTGLENMSGVEPAKTVAEAMAWKMSSDRDTVTPDQWRGMIPLIHEA